tara:strand:- start:370 stop:930 length:561 start_codon:yes stop_codon:yes gene_type:complete
MKIAFAGKMGTGKTSATNFLSSIYTDSFNTSFAEPIYDILNYAQKVTNQSKKKDRLFLQFIGTEWGRNIDQNLWINLLLDRTKNFSNHCFISDLRFSNEFKFLKENGWICVLIERDNTEYNSILEERIGNGNVNHSSENDLTNIPRKDWDFIIENNGSEREFQINLLTMCAQIKKTCIPISENCIN